VCIGVHPWFLFSIRQILVHGFLDLNNTRGQTIGR
jgi:hypothetical protein